MWEYDPVRRIVTHVCYGSGFAGICVTRDAELHILTEDLASWTDANVSYTSEALNEIPATVGMNQLLVVTTICAHSVQRLTGGSSSGNAESVTEDLTVRAGRYVRYSTYTLDERSTLFRMCNVPVVSSIANLTHRTRFTVLSSDAVAYIWLIHFLEPTAEQQCRLVVALDKRLAEIRMSKPTVRSTPAQMLVRFTRRDTSNNAPLILLREDEPNRTVVHISSLFIAMNIPLAIARIHDRTIPEANASLSRIPHGAGFAIAQHTGRLLLAPDLVLAALDVHRLAVVAEHEPAAVGLVGEERERYPRATGFRIRRGLSAG